MKNAELEENGLGAIIKEAMRERGLSVRKLGELSNISPSSISRIINNKQSAGLRHLRILSKHLGIPVERMLSEMEGAGQAPLYGEKAYGDAYFILDTIREILEYYDMDICDVMKDIKKELAKYEQYAKTEEGKNKIVNEYKIKREACSGLIAERLDMLYRTFCSKDTSPKAKPVIGSALLYFILSADIIPDYIFPIGYLDDAIAVRLVLSKIERTFSLDEVKLGGL